MHPELVGARLVEEALRLALLLLGRRQPLAQRGQPVHLTGSEGVDDVLSELSQGDERSGHSGEVRGEGSLTLSGSRSLIRWRSRAGPHRREDGVLMALVGRDEALDHSPELVARAHNLPEQAMMLKPELVKLGKLPGREPLGVELALLKALTRPRGDGGDVVVDTTASTWSTS